MRILEVMNHPVKPRTARRPRGSLSRQQVVDAALQLADQDGLEALSMLTLARRLECGVMTIYGYVENKEDLLDAIALRGLADVRLPRPLPGEPRAVLVDWGRALRLALLEHPSLPTIFLSQAVIGPSIFQGMETLLGALSRARTPARFGLHAIYAVVIYTAGFATWELPRTRRQPESAYAAAWRRAFASLRQEDFPLTASVLDELPRLASEQQFEIGLTALADGLLNAAQAA